jgi:hypothetical protein
MEQQKKQRKIQFGFQLSAITGNSTVAMKMMTTTTMMMMINIIIIIIIIIISSSSSSSSSSERLCGLVVRVLGYRSGGPG